jgi:hypothetical protein
MKYLEKLVHFLEWKEETTPVINIQNFTNAYLLSIVSAPAGSFFYKAPEIEKARNLQKHLADKPDISIGELCAHLANIAPVRPELSAGPDVILEEDGPYTTYLVNLQLYLRELPLYKEARENEIKSALIQHLPAVLATEVIKFKL